VLKDDPDADRQSSRQDARWVTSVRHSPCDTPSKTISFKAPQLFATQNGPYDRRGRSRVDRSGSGIVEPSTKPTSRSQG
jgi:hypothetical protein